MAPVTGRRLPLSLPRRFIGDLIHFAQRIPLCTAQRTMRLADEAAARARARPRPGWCAVFTKAYALTARRRPELRRAYVAFPWPHLYEHPHNVASVAVERRYGDEDAVFFTHLRAPEDQPLSALDAHLGRCREEPVESIALFRRILTTSARPRWLRRLLWWAGLGSSGRRRARYLGTFGVSAISHLGATSLQLLTPAATALNYGVLGPDGASEVRLTYDHRVLDGGGAARALAEMEAALHGEVLAELTALGGAGEAGKTIALGPGRC